MKIDRAIEALIAGLEVGRGSDELVAELSLSPEEERRVRLELTCVHILAGHFAIAEVFHENVDILEALLAAYHRYWLIYSDAVSFNYGEAVYQRLARYREALLPAGDGAGVQAGRVFAELCDLTTPNLTALGANAFTTRFGCATTLLASWDIELEEPDERGD